MSFSVTSRARRSTFGTTPSDRRCNTNGQHPQPEVSQLGPFLSRKRKDRVRLTPREQPPSSRTLRSANPRTHESRFRIPEFKIVGKVFCVESYRPNVIKIRTPSLGIRTSSIDIRTCKVRSNFPMEKLPNFLVSCESLCSPNTERQLPAPEIDRLAHETSESSPTIKTAKNKKKKKMNIKMIISQNVCGLKRNEKKDKFFTTSNGDEPSLH